LNSPESGMESLEEDDEVEEAITYKIGMWSENIIIYRGHIMFFIFPTIYHGQYFSKPNVYTSGVPIIGNID
jgi:hypothetical protein